MNKLMQHGFNIALAAEYGLEEAILLASFQFFTHTYIANKDEERFFEGRYWFYNTRQGWVDAYPYISEDKIRRALINLHEAGIIHIGNHNKVKTNRTKWYALSDKGLELLGFPPLGKIPNGMGEIPNAVGESPNVINNCSCPTVPVLSVPLEQGHVREAPPVDNSSDEGILGLDKPIVCNKCKRKKSYHTNHDPSEKQIRQGYWKSWHYCNTCKTKMKPGDGEWIPGHDPHKTTPGTKPVTERNDLSKPKPKRVTAADIEAIKQKHGVAA